MALRACLLPFPDFLLFWFLELFHIFSVEGRSAKAAPKGAASLRVLLFGQAGEIWAVYRLSLLSLVTTKTQPVSKELVCFLTKLCHFGPPPLKGERRRGKKMAELRSFGTKTELRTFSQIHHCAHVCSKAVDKTIFVCQVLKIKWNARNNDADVYAKVQNPLNYPGIKPK